MEIYLDCLPCVMRQVLEASRMSTDNAEHQQKIMEEGMRLLSEYKKYTCSPDIVRDMHQIVMRITGVQDPYRKIKDRDIATALKLYPFLVDFLKSKDDKLYWLLKIAATGNILDSALFSNNDVESTIEKELNMEFAICDIAAFREKLRLARTLLIIGDNAGETVFDRVFTEQFPHLDIYYAVRSSPVINDATIDDAYASGIGESVKIISCGCDTPGVMLDRCSAEFMDLLDKADIVLSKGQGNFESLSDSGREIFYLLKAKCPVIADNIGVSLFDYVFKHYPQNAAKEMTR